MKDVLWAILQTWSERPVLYTGLLLVLLAGLVALFGAGTVAEWIAVVWRTLVETGA